jgi:hypothetical protein
MINCDRCPYTTTSLKNFRIHRARKHGEKVPQLTRGQHNWNELSGRMFSNGATILAIKAMNNELHNSKR